MNSPIITVILRTGIILCMFLTGCKKEKHSFVIGESFGGGIVFYIDSTGRHGLMAAPNDQGNAPWGCALTDLQGAEGQAIGTGAQNTIDIEAGCTEPGTAADICANLKLNGHSDWFLPSQEELNLIYTNLFLNNLGDFTDQYYWSSTENGIFNAYGRSFSAGGGGLSKETSYSVRAVRSF